MTPAFFYWFLVLFKALILGWMVVSEMHQYKEVRNRPRWGSNWSMFSTYLFGFYDYLIGHRCVETREDDVGIPI